MNVEDRLAAILGAWQDEREQGRFVDPETLYARHPDLARELRIRLAALDVIEQAFAENRILQGDAPKRLGEFEIVREIGRGGMGVVYEARQSTMGRTVALKVLYPGVTGSRRAIERFQREAQAAGRVQHTNIVPVYNLSREGGTWYYAMELVKGRSLATLLAELRNLGPARGADAPTLITGVRTEGLAGSGPSSAPDDASVSTTERTTQGAQAYHREVARLFAGVADALHAAHEEGIIHRDVKPSNLILDTKGVLKLVDFGIARIGGDGGDMTMTGEVLGTPMYMSPEQASAKTATVDHRTDVYSLGASLYEALTLRTPFVGSSLAEVYEQILTTPPIAPRRHVGTIARDLETIVLKAMEKEPARRYASAAELAHDLRAFADGHAISTRRITVVGRLWRKAKRHKALTTVTSLLLLAVLIAGALVVRAGDEEDRRRNAQYDLLVQEATIALGFADKRDGAPGAGEALLNKAIGLVPDRPEAYVGLALLGDQGVEQRLAALGAAESRGVSPASAARLRAVVLSDADRRDEAEDAEKGLPGPPEVPSPLDALALGLRAVQTEDADQAIAHLTTVILRASPTSLYTYMARRERAPLLAQKGRLREALDDLHEVRARGDRGADPALLTAALWRRLGDQGKAESLLAESIADDLATMADWHALLESMHYMRGQMLYAQGEKDAGLSALRHAVAVPGSGENTRMLLVKVLLREGYADEAVEVLEQAMREFPDKGRPPAWMGLVLTERARTDANAMKRAEALAKRAIAAGNAGSIAHLVLATALHRQGRHREALEALVPIANAGRAEFMAVSIAVLAHCALGEVPEARAKLEASIAGVPASDRRWQSEVERRLRYEALTALEHAE
ncbi:MAG: protein kinase [Planctomycetota bacterium]